MRVSWIHESSAVVVAVSGRVDLVAADSLSRVLDTAIMKVKDLPGGALFVDLGAVSFFGEAACAELVWAAQTCAELRVLLPSSAVLVEDRATIEQFVPVARSLDEVRAPAGLVRYEPELASA